MLRSIDPVDYQTVPRPVAAMAKAFPDGFHISRHHHQRDQLIWSVSGTMRVRTDEEAWLVPPDRAVWVPAYQDHAIDMRGEAAMRTLYVRPGAVAGLPGQPTVLEMSTLLRALILALVVEPVLYDEAGRGGAIAALILSEITVAPRLPLVLPMPRDGRLQRVCSALLDNPSSDLTLDGWSEQAGASARTLARLFEREVGLSFAAWRQRVRFHGALEALSDGEPIGLVARRFGYRSPSAFSAAFRKAMGVAPSAVARDDGRRRQIAGTRPAMTT
jgi:AraC-like DNA-binding protein